jgi:hypothetical protein
MTEQPLGEYPPLQGAIDHLAATALHSYRELVAQRNQLRNENIALTARLAVAETDRDTWRALATGNTQCP